ncbi:hypothetical protein KVF89_06245 [Nocardioides carbamazepini]|uniref:hypothetical protein n=1 Tax=Nocardioides carbamazepini TaxID=2854259 RepID=UPI00214A3C95|nr:hypothetical protein [Nocardioides carbamazepini]MCR1782127.1 hypothetical protein [Nocardioides carbamazepini]
MKLHQSLAQLARDHGHTLFRDAAAFRGSLDDYLDEGQASGGTINLLTDAVRLGALDALVSMLDSGANPTDAVESAGQRLARDRGSADVRGCQWAVAVLGFALGRVPEPLVAGLDPDAGTAAPPGYGPGGTAPTQPPVTSPMAPPTTSPVTPPQQPIMPPPQPTPQQPAPPYGAPAPPPAAWSQPTPPKKSKTGLIVAAIAVALVLVVAGIIGIIAVVGSDDDKAADDPASQTTDSAEPTDSTDPSDDPDDTDEPTDDGSDAPDLGGPAIQGTGYEAHLPKGWIDGTDELTAQSPDAATLDRVFIWGATFNAARGNVIVEIQSAYGSSDPADLKDDWKEALTAGDATASTIDIDDTTIDGQSALGVDISRTNDNDVDVAQRSYLVISGDTAYSITVSLKDGDDDVLDRFTEILDAWQWTE